MLAFLLLAGPIERVVPILDHMLGAFIFEVLGNETPFGAVLLNQLIELLILLLGPMPLLDIGIQIIFPLLPALLLTPRVLPLGLFEQLKRHHPPIYMFAVLSKIKTKGTL